jgi:hypothetical protein
MTLICSVLLSTVMPVLSKLRQEDLEFKSGLGYRERLCLKNKKQKNTKLGWMYVCIYAMQSHITELHFGQPWIICTTMVSWDHNGVEHCLSPSDVMAL